MRAGGYNNYDGAGSLPRPPEPPQHITSHHVTYKSHHITLHHLQPDSATIASHHVTSQHSTPCHNTIHPIPPHHVMSSTLHLYHTPSCDPHSPSTTAYHCSHHTNYHITTHNTTLLITSQYSIPRHVISHRTPPPNHHATNTITLYCITSSHTLDTTP